MSSKRILPPTYFLASVALMVVLHFFLPIIESIPRPFNYLGLLPIAAGLVLNIWSSSLFKKSQTTIKPFEQPAKLVADGPFCFSRNPMYLGMVLALLGLFVLLGSLTPLVPIPVFVWIIATRFIPPEEKAMERSFGQDYLGYKNRVRRWI